MKYFTLNNKKRLAFSLIIFCVIIVAVLITVLATVSSGEAEGKIEEEGLKERAMSEIENMIPEATRAEEMPEYSTDESLALGLKDEGENFVSVVVVDRTNGQIHFMLDLREESKTGASANQNIKADQAKAIADSLLQKKGVNLTDYQLEKEPLQIVGMIGVSDPQPIYRYEFHYRIQKNGIFVDDYEYGGGSCLVEVSPEDGRIVSYSLPKQTLSFLDKKPSEVRISKEEAIKIGFEKALNIGSNQLIAVAVYENIEMRYFNTTGDELTPYWKIEYFFKDKNQKGEVPEWDTTTYGGVIMGISAVNGEVLIREQY